MAAPAQGEASTATNTTITVKQEDEQSLQKALAAAVELTTTSASPSASPFAPESTKPSPPVRPLPTPQPKPQPAAASSAPVACMSPAAPAPKRPLSPEDTGGSKTEDAPEAKRVKVEPEEPSPATIEPGLKDDSMEDILEDLMSLIPTNFAQSIETSDEAGPAAAPKPSHQAASAPLGERAAETQVLVRSPTNSMERDNERVLSYIFSDPEEHIRIANIPVLSSMAIQVLLMLRAQLTAGDFKATRGTASELALGYKKVKSLFDAAKSVFAPAADGAATTWLWEDDLGTTDADLIAATRLANMATLLALVVDDGQALSEAHNVFFDAITPASGELTQPVGDLLLAIKCKLVISTLRTSAAAAAASKSKEPMAPPSEASPSASRSRSDQMTEIMIGGLETKMRKRHKDGQLPSRDAAFLNQVQGRKDKLYREIGEEDNRDYLRVKLEDYHDYLLESVAAFLKSRANTLLDEASRFGVTLPMPEPEPEDAQMGQASNGLTGGPFGGAEDLMNGTLLDLVDQLNAHQQSEEELQAARQQMEIVPENIENMEALEALVENMTKDYVQNKLSQLAPNAPWASGSGSTAPADIMAAARAHARQETRNNGEEEVSLPPHQTVPTTVLYEKARQAAITKSSTTTRREGTNGSARRPWTPEEEKALMMGLDIVKGPHWSQILSLFGHGGSISPILKDRSQVQLKDKARNLKLFFLKTNSEVPYYLQSVTGELKTRAPTQAARKEAEEKAREGQATKIDGTMALDSLKHHGQQHHQQLQNGHKPQGPAAAGRGGLAVAPAPPSTMPSTPTGAAAQAASRGPEFSVGGHAAAVAQYTTQHQHPSQQQQQQQQHTPILPASARPAYVTQPHLALQTPKTPLSAGLPSTSGSLLTPASMRGLGAVPGAAGLQRPLSTPQPVGRLHVAGAATSHGTQPTLAPRAAQPSMTPSMQPTFAPAQSPAGLAQSSPATIQRPSQPPLAPSLAASRPQQPQPQQPALATSSLSSLSTPQPPRTAVPATGTTTTAAAAAAATLTPQQVQAQENAREAELLQNLKKAT